MLMARSIAYDGWVQQGRKVDSSSYQTTVGGRQFEVFKMEYPEEQEGSELYLNFEGDYYHSISIQYAKKNGSLVENFKRSSF